MSASVMMRVCSGCGLPRTGWDSPCKCVHPVLPSMRIATPLEFTLMRLRERLTQSQWIVCAEGLRIINEAPGLTARNDDREDRA